MNLQNEINQRAEQAGGGVAAGNFGQTRPDGLLSARRMMSLFVRRSLFVALTAGVVACSLPALAQTAYYTTNGTEYPVVGALPGDQMFPDVALSANGGGFMVWQDNATDGDGWGISACRVDSTLSGVDSPFRVNVQGASNQENARVAMLKNGGGVFVWQGGPSSSQHIYARFLSPTNTWLTSDVLVSTYYLPGADGGCQISPAVATLTNGNVVVVWSSYNQADSGSLLDVYAKILSPSGETVKNIFLVNQVTAYNQRTPTVAALKNGGFVVAWVSEQQRLTAPVMSSNSVVQVKGGSFNPAVSTPSVDIYARLYTADGTASGDEFRASVSDNPCANPAVAAASDGSFLLAWSEYDRTQPPNTWDVHARAFDAGGQGGPVLVVNTYLAGSQYAPRLAAQGLDYLVTWTSMKQDGSREGVYGRFVHADGTLTGGELRVNTTTVSQQMHPVVASDGKNQFLVVWTSFNGLPNSFDLYAQRYVNVDAVLEPMAAPFVYAPFTLSNNVYQPQLQVMWAPLAGISISQYEIYVDGALRASTTNSTWTMTAAEGLQAGSTHSFQVDYVKPNGSRSPLSEATSGTTWGGMNDDGVPFEWMTLYYGPNFKQWPDVNAPLVPNGPSLINVFATGGNPLDSSTWLVQKLSRTSQGMFLSWNTHPGFTYQVQTRTNLTAPWTNLGAPRFAAGTVDSLYVGGTAAGFYQIKLLR